MDIFPSLKTVAQCLILTVISVLCIQFWLERKGYLFDEKTVSSIAIKHLDGKDSYPEILDEFRLRYPGHILPDKDLQWVFINAGGWMGSMCLLHASLTEYLLFFGTAVDTSGHSGRYWANISDTILSGSFKQWKEGELHSVEYKKGDTVFHAWGEVAAVSWTADTWMVEYGRGFIPSTLGFALSDTIFSTQDFVTMFYVFKVYTKALLQEAGFAFFDAKTFIKESL